MSEAASFAPRLIMRRNLLHTVSSALVIGAVLAALLLSNLAVTALGLHYDVDGGLPFEKVHPASYIATLALIAWLWSTGNPFIGLDEIIRHHRGLVLFLFTWLFLLIHIIIVLRGPFTNIVDTFLLPPLMLILLARLDETSLHRLAKIIHVVLAVNAVLGMVELATGWRLTPLIVSGAALSSDWRPSALFGHPLANAAAIGTYVVVCLLGGARDLNPVWRVPALLLQFLALAIFGGRVASVLVIPFAAIALAIHFGTIVRERRITPLAAAAVTIGVPLAFMAMMVAISAGVFDQFATRFVDDDGSAKTRYEMFVLLAELPTADLIFGPDSELLATLKRQLGLEFGIESFWVSLVANYGLLSSGFFLIGLLCLCLSIVHASYAKSAWVVVYFFIVASSSESLASKTLSFSLMVIFIMILLRRSQMSRR